MNSAARIKQLEAEWIRLLEDSAELLAWENGYIKDKIQRKAARKARRAAQIDTIRELEAESLRLRTQAPSRIKPDRAVAKKQLTKHERRIATFSRPVLCVPIITFAERMKRQRKEQRAEIAKFINQKPKGAYSICRDGEFPTGRMIRWGMLEEDAGTGPRQPGEKLPGVSSWNERMEMAMFKKISKDEYTTEIVGYLPEGAIVEEVSQL